MRTIAILLSSCLISLFVSTVGAVVQVGRINAEERPSGVKRGLSVRPQMSSGSPPAFPGATGFGAEATGARGFGAQVCIVTSLADSGPGSFRECAEQTPPAYVTFAVSGYIDLVDEVRISGNKTIECATAPGDGIVFRKASVDVTGDNVILRGCRAWAGKDHSEEPIRYRDGIFIQKDGSVVQRVIVANSSMRTIWPSIAAGIHS